MPASRRSRRSPWTSALASARARVHRLPGGHTVWRVGVAVLGLLLIVIGIILLPLPGPGWLIIFIGLGVWATEFTWADRLLAVARRFFRAWTAWLTVQRRWVQVLTGVAGLVIVGAVAVGSWLWYRDA